MPNITVTNQLTTAITLPGGYYSDPIAGGGSATFNVPDADEFLGITEIATWVAAGYIIVEMTSGDTTLRPIPVMTTAAITAAGAANYASGTLIWDSTRMKLVASVSNVWRDQTVVVAGTTAVLGALTNVPTNAVAFNTDTQAIVRYNGAAFVSCSLANPAASQAGLPANPHLLGQLTRNDTTQSLLVCTTPGSPGTWDSIFVAPTGTTGAPPAEAAALAGGAYFNTNTSRLSFHDGAAWVHLPVATYDTAANIAVLAGAVVTAGQYGWASDTNRLAVYTGAAWYNETTVGMYAAGATHAYTGAVVFDPTGFVGTMVGNGRFQVYNGAAWVPNSVVVPQYAGGPGVALPVVGDVPEGFLAIDNTGGAGTTLYAKIGGAWVTGL